MFNFCSDTTITEPVTTKRTNPTWKTQALTNYLPLTLLMPPQIVSAVLQPLKIILELWRQTFRFYRCLNRSPYVLWSSWAQTFTNQMEKQDAWHFETRTLKCTRTSIWQVCGSQVLAAVCSGGLLTHKTIQPGSSCIASLTNKHQFSQMSRQHCSAWAQMP